MVVVALALVAALLGGLGYAVGRRTTPTVHRTAMVLVGSGVQDGVSWRQYAWADGARVCTETLAGASSTSCNVPNLSLPFSAAGEVPVSPPGGATRSRSEIVYGVVSEGVTRVQVVGSNHQRWDAHLERCPCHGIVLWPSGFFSLAVTQEMALREPDGSYSVMVVAYEGSSVETGRVRVPLINIGYCPSQCPGNEP